MNVVHPFEVWWFLLTVGAALIMMVMLQIAIGDWRRLGDSANGRRPLATEAIVLFSGLLVIQVLWLGLAIRSLSTVRILPATLEGQIVAFSAQGITLALGIYLWNRRR